MGCAPLRSSENFAIFKSNLRDLMHTFSSSSLTAFFKNFFSALLVLCVLYLFTVLRRCFTPVGLIHLSLLLSPPFLSIFSPLFSFSSFLFLFLSFLLFFFFISPCRFLGGDRRHAAPLSTGLLQKSSQLYKSSFNNSTKQKTCRL